MFAHAARFAWHNDDPDYDALATLHNLQLGYVRSLGYVNLRCAWVLGCPGEIHPELDALDEPYEVAMQHLDPKHPPATKHVYKQAFQELMPGEKMPELVGVACCSQFAVSRETIRRRSRGDYVRWRDWLLNTALIDDVSGRVLEYTWHSEFLRRPAGKGRGAGCLLTRSQSCLEGGASTVQMLASATAKSLGCVTCDAMRTNATGDMYCQR